MTKLKSKKMTKSTFAVIVLSILMVAMLAFGGTYAYFSAVTGELASSGVKTGKVALSTTAQATNVFVTGKVMPGDPLLKADIEYSYETSDPNGQWVSVRVTVTSDAEGLANAVVTNNFSIGADFGTATSIADGVAIYTVKVTDATGTLTLDKTAFALPLGFGGAGNVQTPEGLMEADVTVKVEARAIQGSSVANAPAAEALIWATTQGN